MENVVTTLAPSFLQVLRTIKVRMRSKIGQIEILTAELAALERLIIPIDL